LRTDPVGGSIGLVGLYGERKNMPNTFKGAEFVGPDVTHYVKGDDLDHVYTVRRWVDPDGNVQCRELVTPFSTFVECHGRSSAIIAEIQRKRAERHISELPVGKRRKA